VVKLTAAKPWTLTKPGTCGDAGIARKLVKHDIDAIERR
jgi:hypothetical protein